MTTTGEIIGSIIRYPSTGSNGPQLIFSSFFFFFFPHFLFPSFSFPLFLFPPFPFEQNLFHFLNNQKTEINTSVEYYMFAANVTESNKLELLWVVLMIQTTLPTPNLESVNRCFTPSFLFLFSFSFLFLFSFSFLFLFSFSLFFFIISHTLSFSFLFLFLSLSFSLPFHLLSNLSSLSSSSDLLLSLSLPFPTFKTSLYQDNRNRKWSENSIIMSSLRISSL